MKKLSILFLLFAITDATHASDIPPTARITLENPARSELIGYTGETLIFSSATSTANCGSITLRLWKLDSGSWTSSMEEFTHTFTLPTGVYEQTHTLQLRVVNSCAGLDDIITKTVTIRRDQRTYFVKDHLGSVRATVNEAGDVISYDDYYPFGLTMPGRSSNSANPNDKYKFTGYEHDDEAGLDLYHANARTMDPVLGRFMQIDPLFDQGGQNGWSPYHYTLNNPMNRIDPTGLLSTLVEENEDGTYTVVGGDPNDGDTGIYVGSKDGEKIGESLTTHSFFDANDNAVVGATIDLSSTEGQDFLDNEIIGDNPSLATYAFTEDGGGNNAKLDFKNRGVDQRGANTSVQQHRYRGSVTKDGKIASARDFGNVGAGIVAARNGLSNQVTRLAFDIYNGGQEPKVSRLAQNVGLKIGQKLFIRELKVLMHD